MSELEAILSQFEKFSSDTELLIEELVRKYQAPMVQSKIESLLELKKAILSGLQLCIESEVGSLMSVPADNIPDRKENILIW